MTLRLALALCLLSACQPGGGETRSPEPQLVLGSGEWQWQDVEGGDGLTLARGTQGGYHIWLSMRTRGLSPDRVLMELELTPAGGEAQFSRVRIDFDEPADDAAFDEGFREFLGWPAQLLDPWCAVDQPLDVSVTLEDVQGATVHERMEVIPLAPAAGFPVDCEP